MVAHGRTLVVLGALAAAPAALAQSAFDQLCTAAGGNCNVNVPMPSAPEPVRTPDVEVEARSASQRAPAKSPPRLTSAQQMKMTIATTLVEGILQGIFAPSPRVDPAAAEAARQAQLAAQREAQRRREEQVRGQRAARELENGASMEEMRAALSDPFDGGVPLPPAPLPGAPVVLDPDARTVATFAPPENPFRKPGPPAPPPGTTAADKLARMAAENEDVAVLASNLSDLEARLAEAQGRMVDLKRGFNWLTREYERHEQDVAKTVEDAKERGMSLALDGLLKGTPKAIDALGEVRANGKAWGTLVGLLRETDGANQAIAGAAEFVGDRAEEAAWLGGEKDLRTNLTFLAKKLGGPYAEAGESIVASAMAVRRQVEAARAMRELSGVDAAYRREFEQLKPALAELEQRTRAAREAVARRTGLSTDELKVRPEPPKGLGSVVPHPYD